MYLILAYSISLLALFCLSAVIIVDYLASKKKLDKIIKDETNT